MATTYKIKIAARLRPPIPGELVDDGVQVERRDDGTSCVSVPNPRDLTQIFKFPITSCYDPAATQREIFENEVRPIIDIVYNGVTVTVFAYGVTSSGKTHTMQGSKAEPGIIPRAVEALFHKQSGLRRYRSELSVSYMEIYKDEVYDLLVNRENAPKLPVRENDRGQVFVANLTAIPMDSVADFEKIYSQASKNRSVASTNLNRASSRSHAILTVTVTLTDPAENKTLSGKLNLVDLAGSENNKMTGNDPSRMAESAAINKSLSTLGQVVHALNKGHSRIPYRNSKLTRLLQDALGGSSVGLLICNLAPGTKFRQDTLNTLNFAVHTKNIENKPVVNEKDNRPVPKPHFAALPAPPPKLAAAMLPISSSSSHGGRPSLVSAPASRPSSSSSNVSSRVPRPSVGGFGTASRLSQLMHPPAPSAPKTVTLTDKEIDERIARAVEAEVARRLAEHANERAREEATRREEEVAVRLAEELAKREAKRKGKAPEQHQESLPLNTLTPLMHRHEDANGDELKKRLEELEQKFEHSSREVQMVDVLSPVSRKRTGRAYVSLARSHSEKGNLQLALELYRKAETYVPDNIKLKERIIEVERAIESGRPFEPSPKRSKKGKVHKTKTSSHSSQTSITSNGSARPSLKGESTHTSLHDAYATVDDPSTSSRQEAAVSSGSSSIPLAPPSPPQPAGSNSPALPPSPARATRPIPAAAISIQYSRYQKTTAGSTATSASEVEGKENVRLDTLPDAEAEGLLHVGSPPKRQIDEMQGDVLETPPRHKKVAKVAPDDDEEGAESGAWEQWQLFEPGKRR
ncbi:uncharacterized protein PHACADRAFT_193079 [Phanerochaete carnosa HHB-10118-sp]|uniref:Kinesin-like protein n=1 Tax=Phanerochaete carnosa (strain HHB-10118-sp) TaxID=650164 RepID=K5WF86_PHACS|nr:uncharacterized protein PHACADRAFT_193079 [Phanerochaete carnosa HHB-10118-sp]EKM57950.1 hypothetical protein PHACADRAFT_193079 [Phanerochaete carnosa HHB-10118-sp]